MKEQLIKILDETAAVFGLRYDKPGTVNFRKVKGNVWSVYFRAPDGGSKVLREIWQETGSTLVDFLRSKCTVVKPCGGCADLSCEFRLGWK